MNAVTLTSVDPTPDDVQYLEDRIYEFNAAATKITDGELLAFFVREDDRIVAGICGNTWGGTCELRQFWVDQSRRHRGLGTQLFQAGGTGSAAPRLHADDPDDVFLSGAGLLREARLRDRLDNRQSSTRVPEPLDAQASSVTARETLDRCRVGSPGVMRIFDC